MKVKQPGQVNSNNSHSISKNDYVFSKEKSIRKKNKSELFTNV